MLTTINGTRCPWATRRFALGGQYFWTPKVTMSGAYEFAWGGNLR
jgi:hypothetical protein